MHSCEHVKQSLFLRYSIIVLFPYDVSRSLLAARISEYVHYTIKFFSGKTHSTRNYWTNIVERLGKFSLFFLFLKWCSHLLWKSKEGHVYIEWEKDLYFPYILTEMWRPFQLVAQRTTPERQRSLPCRWRRLRALPVHVTAISKYSDWPSSSVFTRPRTGSCT